MLRTSRYNLTVPIEQGVVLYNSRTGASRRFSGVDARDFASALSCYPARIDETEIDQLLLASLVEGGFLRPPEADELAEIRSLYERAKADAAIIVTITLTNNCNLGCYYCFQKRDESSLGYGNKAEICRHVEEILHSSGKRSLHVDWYGGEPMLNQNFLNELSQELQQLCEQMQVRYSASMLSNGTLWPFDPVAFVTANRIERVQLTFDGYEGSHSKVRRPRRGFESQEPFEALIALVSLLKDHITLDLRFNLSPTNADDLLKLCQFGIEHGWFASPSRAKLQIAKLTPYSQEVDFLRKVELSYAEFEEVRDRVRHVVPEPFLDRTAELDRYPSPRDSVCAAIAQDSVVIGADGKLYNCGLQVTEPHRSVGELHGLASDAQLGEGRFWSEFDPTHGQRCGKCSFLPLCWGACPKLHLEGDTESLKQQSDFWRAMLPRRLAASLDLKLEPGFAFTDKDQFKTGL
ncbi:radical SAM/SPASM domain-containing protein [Agrobacterium vitis]|uniref:SPASM domain-containing protein n=1 Tax=Agrobacterium vitis TaxID=373 RepID=A0A7K1RNH4_AGRVI|nr:SPASM domain-containing protein [Agrobacterium vitis]MVA59593.1 SPASM domain-containing protein [Agrobacterium vitis]